MSNKIYNLKYYNEYQKMRFLSNISGNATYDDFSARILGRVSREEERLGKDLYDFSLPQIERFLRYLNPTKISTSRMDVQLVYNYIQWANSQHLRKTNIHPMGTIMSEDYFKSFIDESKQTIFSEDEIEDIIRECKNAQDQVVIQLLFEGVHGKGLNEILNLQRKNIDISNNCILLTDDDESTRILKVSDKCMKLIEDALNQTMYQKNNGIFESDRGSAEIALVDNDYVVKTTTLGKLKSFDKADKFLIHRKLKTLSTFFDKHYFSPKNIWFSGMLKIAKDHYFNGGTIIDKDCTDEIGRKFNIRKVEKKGNVEYVVSPYKRDFLNIETIRKVYDID